MKKKNFLCMVLMLGFLVGIKDGYITLWRDGDAKPLRVFPYRAEMLPIADQKALEKGIHLDSDSQLAQLLEDYLS